MYRNYILFVQHFPKLFKAENPVTVFVKLVEDCVDLFLVELLGNLLKLLFGDVSVVVFVKQLECPLSL